MYFENDRIDIDDNDVEGLCCAEIDVEDEKLVEKFLNMKLVAFGSCRAWWGYATVSQIDEIKNIVENHKGCITIQNIKESNCIEQTEDDEGLDFKNCDESGIIFYYNEINRLFCVDKYTRKGDKADFVPYQSFKKLEFVKSD